MGRQTQKERAVDSGQPVQQRICALSASGAALFRAAGTDAKTMFIGSKENGYEVIIEDGVAKLPDRSAFAGSIATADRLVRNMLKYADCGICDAVRMMTATPAAIMKINDRGTLTEGKIADICVFDDNVNITDVYLKGQKVCL